MKCFQNQYITLTSNTDLAVCCAQVVFINLSDGPVYVNNLKLLPFSSHTPPGAVSNDEKDVSVYRVQFDSTVTQPALIVIQKNYYATR